MRHGSHQFLIGLSGLRLLLLPLQDGNPHPVDPFCQFPQLVASPDGDSVLHLAALQNLKLLLQEFDVGSLFLYQMQNYGNKEQESTDHRDPVRPLVIPVFIERHQKHRRRSVCKGKGIRAVVRHRHDLRFSRILFRSDHIFHIKGIRGIDYTPETVNDHRHIRLPFDPLVQRTQIGESDVLILNILLQRFLCPHLLLHIGFLSILRPVNPVIGGRMYSHIEKKCRRHGDGHRGH